MSKKHIFGKKLQDSVVFFLKSFLSVFKEKKNKPRNTVSILCFALFKTETIEANQFCICETNNEVSEVALTKLQYELQAPS